MSLWVENGDEVLWLGHATASGAETNISLIFNNDGIYHGSICSTVLSHLQIEWSVTRGHMC